MDMKTLVIALLIFLVVIRAQLRSRQLSARQFFLPLLVLLFGMYTAASIPGIAVGDWVTLFVGTVLGLIVGMIQGKFVRVFQEGGVWYIAGSIASVGLWLVSIPIRYGLKYGMSALIATPDLFSFDSNNFMVPFLFSIAGLMLGRIIMVCLRYPKQASSWLSH
ncbi:DUF1453 family protein [Tumebacillus flagellatus]|uniref:DUF1453 domain-containing protein n=1 Tax=Tumebacillus flagellatus TaxID=1157490 RepID=A0A074LRV1_9BACL|nr:DUF1453 family protein [Tumebacillus flagellatus]KEO83849.1 hypothetical protein EL26_07995 [Tumebacillus flagellatus]